MELMESNIAYSEYEKSQVLEKLCIFAENLWSEFEKQVLCLDITINNKHASVHLGPIIQQLAKSCPTLFSTLPYKAIPRLTAVIGKQYYQFFQDKTQQQRAKELFKLIDQFKTDKLQVKQLLIRACVDLFLSFEMQFMNCYVDKHNSTRALTKLATEAIHSILNYFINIKAECLSTDLIIKAVLCTPDGKIKQLMNSFSTTPSSKRTIIIENKKQQPQKIVSSKLYSKVGLVENNVYYKIPKISHTAKYGYRCLFEDESLHLKCEKETNQFMEYKYILKSLEKEKIVQEVLDYIKKTNPKQMEDRIKDEIGNILHKIDDIPLEGIICKIFDKAVVPYLIQNHIKEMLVHVSNKITDVKSILEEKRDKIDIPLVPWFQMKESAFNFIGRVSLLQDMHKYFTSGKKTVVVTGLGGIGKSDLCRKYCEENKSYYDNIMWIFSETEMNLVNSFISLATELNIPVRTNAIQRSISCIVQDVFKTIGNFNSLVIFDNAISYASIADFLPIRREMKDTKINILINSQNIDWSDSILLDLPLLEKSESIKLIHNTLCDYINTEDNKQIELINDLVEKVGYLPLALQQAVAYIIEEVKTGTEEPIFEYIRNYRVLLNKNYDHNKIPFPDYFKNSYRTTVFVTLQMSLQRLQAENNINALRIIEICSFLNPEQISKSILYRIYDKNIVNRALRSLEKYSLAKICNNIVNIHRLVLEITRQLTKLEKDVLAYREVLAFSLENNWLVFQVRNEIILSTETVHSQYIFQYSENCIQTLCLFYEQQMSSRKTQLFLLLVYFDCFQAVEAIVKNEQNIKLISYLEQDFNGDIIVINSSIKKENNIADEMLYSWRYAGPATIVACFQDHKKILYFLLNEGADINAKNKFNISLLHAACCNGKIDIVKILLDKGANKNITDDNGSTILHTTTCNKWNILTAFIIRNKILPIDVENNFKDTVLHTAACFGYILPIKIQQDECLEKILYMRSITGLKNILNSILSAFVKDHYESTHGDIIFNTMGYNNSLKQKIIKNNIVVETIPETLMDIALSELPEARQIITFLIDNGANINAENKFAMTPLHLACGCGLYETVSILIIKGASVNKKDKDGLTPLHLAASGGFSSIINLLIENSANVNEINESGLTPLHFSISNGHIITTEKLIKNGANINVVEKGGITYLHMAALSGFTAIVQILLENKVIINNINGPFKTSKDFVNALDNLRQSALHKAVISGHLNVVKLLIEAENDRNVKQINKQSSLLVAASVGHVDIIDWLINNNTDINVRDVHDRTSLILASANGRCNVIKKLIGYDTININAIDFEKRSALHHAVYYGHVEIVKILVNSGIHLNLPDVDGKTELHIAAFSKNTEILELLISVSCIDKIDTNKRTPLWVAVEKGLIENVKYLVNKEANIFSVDANGVSVLEVAVISGHTEIISFLLDYLTRRKINIVLRAPDNETLLHQAALYGQNDIVEYLLNRKIYNINVINDDGVTPLHFAACKGNSSTVELFLSKGADINFVDSHGRSALHASSANGRSDTVKLLIEQKADIFLKDNYGRNCIHFAAANGHRSILELLHNYKLDLSKSDNYGDTLLHIACMNNQLEPVKFLIDKININASNNKLNTPLHFAVAHNNNEIAEFLIANQVDINKVDDEGKSALHYAVQNGNNKIISLLITNGADVNITDIEGKCAIHYTAISDRNIMTLTELFSNMKAD